MEARLALTLRLLGDLVGWYAERTFAKCFNPKGLMVPPE